MKAIEAANNLHQSEPNMGLSFLSENRYLVTRLPPYYFKILKYKPTHI